MDLSSRQPEPAGFPESMFDWAPDAERLEREVRSAELKGVRDDLTLAEIECSLDLLDAEIEAFRHGSRPDLSVHPQLRERIEVRRKLAQLARRLERLSV
jgi:hypothetical protein